MPQARLPDINTAFIIYRREAINSWRGERYDAAIGSLYTFNGLLGEPYRIKISNKEFDEKIQDDIVATCEGCNGEIDFKTVKVYNLLLSSISGMISDKQYERCWSCKCGYTNRLFTTKLIQKVRAEPYYLKVVSKPPKRSEGMMNRTKFKIAFSIWFWSLLNELEASAAKFRDDNWKKGGMLYDDLDIDWDDTEDAPANSKKLIPTIAKAMFPKLPKSVQDALGQTGIEEGIFKFFGDNPDALPKWIEKFIPAKKTEQGTSTSKLQETYL